jgi:hypothetical protein
VVLRRGARGRAPRDRGPGRWSILTLATVAVVVAAGIAAPFLLSGGKTVGPSASPSRLPTPAVTDAVNRVLDTAQYGFAGPDAVAVDAQHGWVANLFGDSVTEFNARTGAFDGTISDGIDSPTSILDNGKNVWILSSNENNSWWITEFDAATGAVITDFRQPSLGAGIATQMSLNGAQIWIASDYSDDSTGIATGLGYVTEINATTGRVIRRLTAASYHFDHRRPTRLPRWIPPAAPSTRSASPPAPC